MKIMIVAGEVSGDIHGAGLIQSLQKENEKIDFFGIGGSKMVRENFRSYFTLENLQSHGIIELIRHIPRLYIILTKMCQVLENERPSILILIDYPGFNLRLAKNSSGLSIPITYFILPQLWAWKEKRIKVFQKYVDQSLSIFPFEQSWFESRGVPTNYVGHPFSENIGPTLTKKEFYLKHNIKTEKRIVTILPGSRQQEVDLLWPVFYESAMKIKEKEDVEIVVGKYSGVKLPDQKNIIIEKDDVYAAMSYAQAAITASGTAALECAVMDTPEVVCYKLSFVSAFIAKRLNKAPFISMVNLIVNRKVVTEFLQNEVRVDNIVEAVIPLLSHTNERKNMLLSFDEMRRSLGLPGVYKRAAESIMKKVSFG